MRLLMVRESAYSWFSKALAILSKNMVAAGARREASGAAAWLSEKPRRPAPSENRV